MADFNFIDWENKITSIGTTEWVEVFHLGEGGQSMAINCALLKHSVTKKALEDCNWDLMIGDHKPGHVFQNKNGKWVGKYYSSTTNGIQPLVRSRHFSLNKYDFLEVSEEFRLFFNLYHANDGSLYKITDTGNEEKIVIITSNSVKIRLIALKEFLSVKNIKLAIFFEETRYFTSTVGELGLKKFDMQVIKGTDYIYKWWGGDMDWPEKGFKSFTRILGKKLISGWKDYKPSPLEKNETSMEFVVDIDTEGKTVSASCNPIFSDYLTPVLFRKAVLSKYYNDPQKYTVGDGFVECNGIWHLRIDNDMKDYVSVFLGDLGRDLPEEERVYWKSHNEYTKGLMSHTGFGRAIKGEFTDPSMPDLFFRYRFDRFNEDWSKKYSWPLFKPLHQDDEHNLKTLRVPITSDHSEFDSQVLSLTKIIIDSLNDAEISKGIVIDAKDAGIEKFRKFLQKEGANYPELIEFLKDLQSLRSTGSAHRKGSRFESIKKKFGIGQKDLKEVFSDILINVIKTLNTLDKHFLKSDFGQ